MLTSIAAIANKTTTTQRIAADMKKYRITKDADATTANTIAPYALISTTPSSPSSGSSYALETKVN